MSMRYLKVCAAAHEPLIKARMRLGPSARAGSCREEKDSNKKSRDEPAFLNGPKGLQSASLLVRFPPRRCSGQFRTVHQFDQGHGCVIPLAESKFQYA